MEFYIRYYKATVIKQPGTGIRTDTWINGTEWRELESIMLSEISQVVTDKYHMISPLTGT